MNHHDAEITDVVVVLESLGSTPLNEAVARLTAAGMQVDSCDSAQGVVEGSIDSCKVHELKSVPGVSYVRSIFTYVADYPPGDPRDQDGAEPDANDDD